MPTVSQISVGTGVTPVLGAVPSGSQVQIINLDTENTVWIGYDTSIQANGSNTIPIGPLASTGLPTGQPIYAIAQAQLTVAIAPGGTAYSPGSLNISGPVTAEISGPVTAEISGTPTVEIGNTPSVNATISGTPTVNISGTPTVDATITGTPTVNVSGITDVSVQNANIDVIGSGGFILPGQTASLYHNASSVTITAGNNTVPLNAVNISAYNSIDFSFTGGTVNASATGTATAALVLVNFYDLSSALIKQYSVYVPIGWGSATGCLGVFSIPCAGSLMTVTVFNNGSSGTITFGSSGIGISGSYRILQDISYSGANPNSYSINSIAYTSSFTTGYPWVCQINNPTMTSGDTYAYLFAGYSGEVKGFYRANGSGVVTIAIVDIGAASTIGNVSNAIDQNYVIYDLTVAASGGILYLDFFLPPSPCAAICSPGASGESFNLQLMGSA